MTDAGKDLSRTLFVEDPHLLNDLDAIYIVDLGGNVRKNPKISGTTHNVFGIQVGVCITFLIRRKKRTEKGQVFYTCTDDFWRKEDKYAFLDEKQNCTQIDWEELKPDRKHNWLTEGMQEIFETFLPMGSRTAKGGKLAEAETIFKSYSLGINTNRDAWAYNFDRNELIANMMKTIQAYNSEVDGWNNRLNRNANED